METYIAGENQYKEQQRDSRFSNDTKEDSRNKNIIFS